MAHVDRERLAPDNPLLDAARHHGLEQFSEQIALAETAVAVLGKRRMIGNVAVKAQATKPAVSQIEVDLFAQPTLRANAEAVADDHIRIISSGSIEGRPTSL